jgi:hypothetical protein
MYMSIYSRTSLIVNDNSKACGLVPYYYRCRNCDTNLTSDAPADQYQRLKLIQKTVRVPSSIYTMNLGALTTNHGSVVSWNQMSDRAVPSVQKYTVPRSKSTRHSSTSSRPGGQNPGGIGCDIKHNSYERRLNRLKGKLLKRGPIPANFGAPIVSTQVNPVSGGKTMTTNIVTSCVCSTANQNRIYIDENNYNLNDRNSTFSVGQKVYAIHTGEDYYSTAIVTIKYSDVLYQVQFVKDDSLEDKPISQLKVYFSCVCDE